MRRDLTQYQIVAPGQLPLWYRIRDILLTVLAWILWLYICWDVFVMLELGLIKEFDANPATKMNWELFFKQLGISYTFSGLVILFLIAGGVFNVLWIARMVKKRPKSVSALDLESEVTSYSATADNVRYWRSKDIITAHIDDTGQIQSISADQEPNASD